MRFQCSETELGQLHCKVCGSAYQLESGGRAWLGRGLTVRHWLQTAVLVTVMCGAAAGCWAVMRFYLDAGVRTAAVGCVIIVYYVCLRWEPPRAPFARSRRTHAREWPTRGI